MLHTPLEQRLREAVADLLPDVNRDELLVRPCSDPRFGDYQATGLIGLAKQRKLNPRQLATDVVAKLDVTSWCRKIEVAGAGFINFHLKSDCLTQVLQAAAQGQHLFFSQTTSPRTVVIDFSSPNVAKPMHVGHIRSTLLGDSLARTLRLLGHHVITDNHIGDWGTQFGMLLVGWKRELNQDQLNSDPLGELERLYKNISAECKAQPQTLELARQELVKLQTGDPENLQIWQQMLQLSRQQFDAVYERLGVKFDHTLGESHYNPQLKNVVKELLDQKIARESDGAIGVFSTHSLPAKQDPFIKSEDGDSKPNPFLIQKSDGAANYATTDLATLRHRLITWNPTDVVYVTDGRQQLHFRQLFATFNRWYPDCPIHLAHVWFGSILGEDGKPFKTRSGETVKLRELLDEAEERAYKVVTQKNPDLPETERRKIAEIVGLGAVKYADLLPNRQSDYVFSWDKMLALTGNTSPYLQYAYARTRSVLRKAADASSTPSTAATATSPSGSITFYLETTEELALLKHLMKFGLVLEGVAAEYRPNFLCNFLYELAGCFSRFWENCPVLKAEPKLRPTRLALCDLTGQVLKQGLEVLGIQTLEQM